MKIEIRKKTINDYAREELIKFCKENSISLTEETGSDGIAIVTLMIDNLPQILSALASFIVVIRGYGVIPKHNGNEVDQTYLERIKKEQNDT